MPHKDFDVPEQAPDDDPITFTLAGHKFTCLPQMPWTTRFMFGSSVIYKRDFSRMVRGCLIEDDEAAWDAALASKTHPVGDKVVEDLFWYLVDEYSERTGERLADKPDTKQAGA